MPTIQSLEANRLPEASYLRPFQPGLEGRRKVKGSADRTQPCSGLGSVLGTLRACMSIASWLFLKETVPEPLLSLSKPPLCLVCVCVCVCGNSDSNSTRRRSRLLATEYPTIAS